MIGRLASQFTGLTAGHDSLNNCRGPFLQNLGKAYSLHCIDGTNCTFHEVNNGSQDGLHVVSCLLIDGAFAQHVAAQIKLQALGDVAESASEAAAEEAQELHQFCGHLIVCRLVLSRLDPDLL